MEQAGYTGPPEKLPFVSVSFQEAGPRYLAMLGPNGNTVDREGRLISCMRADRALVRYEKDGTRTVLATTYQGKTLQNPNDAIVKSDGSIYFTPLGSLPLTEAAPSGVYRWMDGTVTQLAIDFGTSPGAMANGLAFSPDEKYLYVGVTGKIIRFSVQPDGTLADRQQFIDYAGANGMRVDRAGNLYLGDRKGLVVVSPTGKHLGTLPIEGGGNANMDFGDADRKTLYLTVTKGLARVRLNIAGGRDR
jgi:gluconolactonase